MPLIGRLERCRVKLDEDCCARRRTHLAQSGTAEQTEQRIESRRCPSSSYQMVQDLPDLRRVLDHRDDPQLSSAARADKWIDLVDPSQ